jgi:hypothetical protein
MHTHTRGYVLACLLLAACSSGGGTPSKGPGGVATNPDTAPLASIDRFSDGFAHLFKRSGNAALPAPNAPIHMDQGPFLTDGLGPDGEHVAYYNFDVLPTAPAPIYVFFPEGSTAELTEQLHVVDAVPGDPGYNDFWQVVAVTVPAGYVPNSVTSLADLKAAGLTITPTNMLVNCPVVPDGSTAQLRYTAQESMALTRGWYRGQIVKYFNFSERMLMTSAGSVPTAPIYVTFNVNPDPTNPMSGPPSGFQTEASSMQTHNVASVLPEDMSYSPLWMVIAYDDASFSSVGNLSTAEQAPVVVPNAGLVNCPIVAKTSGDGG